jgi:hypothetical protein
VRYVITAIASRTVPIAWRVFRWLFGIVEAGTVADPLYFAAHFYISMNQYVFEF